MQMRQTEQLKGQRIAVAFEFRDVAALHQPVEHPVKLIRTAVEMFCNLGLAETSINACQQFKNVQPLVQRWRAIAVICFQTRPLHE